MTMNRKILLTASLLALFAPAASTRADIFQWQYINPTNPSQGKQQSTTRAPDGAGVNAAPGANLSNRNLTMAYLIAADLTGATARFANLAAAELSQANLTNTDFSGDFDEYNAFPTDLRGANLTGANARGANFQVTLMNDTNFTQANLTNASFNYSDVTGANFTNAEVRGASFSRITTAQLYSTASYQAHDLSGIQLDEDQGWNLAGQNLTNAFIPVAGANLTGAVIRGAYMAHITADQLYSTASYQTHDLTGVYLASNLSGWNFAGQNLTNALLPGTLTGANLTGATVRGAFLSQMAPAQLYSTASYQAGDLSGIRLFNHDLVGWNFAGQNLANSSLVSNLSNANLSQANLTSAWIRSATLVGTNLSQANLTNANFSGSSGPFYDESGNYVGIVIAPGANLANANLSGADARGASFQYATLTGVNSANLIQSNGHIAGLGLTGGKLLVVRDYDGNPAASPPTGALPILVDQDLAMDATGMLRLVFDADPWDSTISFAPGIPVARGGTLDLTFATGVNLASQIGRTLDLFDWTGVNPTGAFNVSSRYTWNLSNLYTTGEVTLTAVPGVLPGDFNHDGVVDAADYIVWRKTDSTPAGYNAWRTHFGQTAGSGAAGYPLGASAASPSAAVPEPASMVMILLIALFAFPSTVGRPKISSSNSSPVC